MNVREIVNSVSDLEDALKRIREICEYEYEDSGEQIDDIYEIVDKVLWPV